MIPLLNEVQPAVHHMYHLVATRFISAQRPSLQHKSLQQNIYISQLWYTRPKQCRCTCRHIFPLLGTYPCSWSALAVRSWVSVGTVWRSWGSGENKPGGEGNASAKTDICRKERETPESEVFSVSALKQNTPMLAMRHSESITQNFLQLS